MDQQSHTLNVWYRINVYDENTRQPVAPHDILFYERMNPLCFKPGPYVVLIVFLHDSYFNVSVNYILQHLKNHLLEQMDHSLASLA